MILLTLISAAFCGLLFLFVASLTALTPDSASLTGLAFCGLLPVLWLHGFLFHRAFSHWKITLSRQEAVSMPPVYNTLITEPRSRKASIDDEAMNPSPDSPSLKRRKIYHEG